ncbi:hypothetical protein P3T76_009079 [Phytophthora citrophthora]|uniref:Crinkler effector protein N-terminal domain-containing protein n=1 Tax=Phytophthora citrophthora TaxID=4793 RepID=A0AAD9GID9_9STRA|nr:hypothetical protein P3T76_009079 [Phytophthora citrophthora]
MKLFYAIVNAVGSPFPVDIDANEYVGDLKKKIRKEKKNKLKNVDADDLVLFLAKKDKGKGTWLTAADVTSVRDALAAQDYRLMDSTLQLTASRDPRESRNRQNVFRLCDPVDSCSYWNDDCV